MRRVPSLLRLAILVVAASLYANAQTSTTSVRGTITDPNGAVVPKSTVTLTNPDTGFSRTAQTDPNGVYVFRQVPPGTYNISANAQGFSEVRAQAVRLLVGTPATVDLKLALAQATSVVEVTSETPLLNTQDAQLGSAFNSIQVTSLPMEGRDPTAILSLQPGVSFVGNNVDQSYDSRNGSVNGARSDQTNVTLDGVDNNDQTQGLAFQGALRPTLDSLQEFRVTTSNANAEAGRSSGAQVQLVTKSGTNTFHGTVYEYHRPTFTTANDWFNKRAQLQAGEKNRPGKLLRNTFGGTVGGPIIKDKLFFFLSYEGQRTRESVQTTRTVPSVALRNGSISYKDVNNATVTLTPAQFAAMDPSCSAAGSCPLGPGANPQVLQVLQSYPVPNTTTGVGDGLNFQGFTFAAPAPSKLDTYIAKLDYNLTSSQHIFVRGNLQNDHFVPADPASVAQFPGQQPNQTDTANNKGIAVGWTSVITQSLVNNLRYGYIRQGLGFSGLQTQPIITFRGLDDLTGATPTKAVLVPVHQISDDVNWTKGTHTIEFGGNWRIINNDRTSNETSFFGASTNPSWLDNAAIANTGGTLDPAAFGHPAVCSGSPNCTDFQQAYDLAAASLAGIVTEVFSNYNRDKTGALIPEGTPIRRKFKTNEFEGYIQDSWRAKPNLTITAGVRYTLLQPPYETNGEQVAPTVSLSDWFRNREAAMLAGQTYRPIVTADLSGQANGKRPLWDWNYRDIAPRFAIAWSPRGGDSRLMHWLTGGSDKTSIRAGYGIYYDHFGQGIIASFDRNGAFGLTTQLSNPAGVQDINSTPRFSAQGNIPQSLVIPGPSGPFPFTPPSTLDTGGFAITWGLDDKLDTPYAHAFNLSLEREMGKGFVFEASYVGRLGRHLLQEEDLAMPLNIKDPKSGMDYFQAATLFAKAANSGVNIKNMAPIPYWENMYPGAAGPFSSVGSGCAPGSTGTGAPTNLTATQAMYDNFACFVGNETTALFLSDVGEICFPACSKLGGYAFFDPQWSSLYAWRSVGNSSYNGAQFSLRHRGGGIQFDVNYTYSKSIDVGSNAERINTFENFGFASQIINSWAPAQLRGPSDFDATHQLNANWVLDLPYGKGQRWGNSAGWMDHILGGWQLTGLVRMSSGLPFTIEPGLGFWSTNWELTSAAMLTGTKPETGVFTDKNGNLNVFKDPTSAASQFRFAYPGESGQRNILRGPGFFGLDAGLAKSWKIGEHQSVKFSWESFNITNHPSFDVGSLQFIGNNSLSTGDTFGTFTSTASKPRSMQFSLRYSF